MPIYYCTIIIRQTPINVNGYRQNSLPLIYFYALRHFFQNVFNPIYETAQAKTIFKNYFYYDKRKSVRLTIFIPFIFVA